MSQMTKIELEKIVTFLKKENSQLKTQLKELQTGSNEDNLTSEATDIVKVENKYNKVVIKYNLETGKAGAVSLIPFDKPYHTILYDMKKELVEKLIKLEKL